MVAYYDNINLRRLRRLVARTPFFHTPTISTEQLTYNEDWFSMRGTAFQEYLYNKILSCEPFMLTRFGCGVLKSAIDYKLRLSISSICKYILGYTDSIDLQKQTVHNVCVGDGFYPADYKSIMTYGKMINDIIPNIDILATIMYQERFFANQLNSKVRCQFYDLEPYRWSNPWTRALQGKKVLVIHPFVNSIKYQYENNRERLFVNPDCLPKFELKLLRAVQDKKISDDPYDQYDTWFDAYDFLCSEVDKIDFDVAILGCGSYGMPLANYIKNKGKQALHIGGAVQFIFGIKNKRADSDDDSAVRDLYNDYWIRTLPEDTPNGYQKIESGCYW